MAQRFSRYGTVRDAEVKLTPTEYRLLTALVRHAGRVLTHRQLLKEVWGPNQVEDAHYLRVFMTDLRRKSSRILRGRAIS